MIDTAEYEGLAREMGAFKDIELDILKETFSAWQARPGDPYTILELRDGKILAGFAVICRKASTDYSFDLRAICVDPSYIGKGVTAKILGMLEEELLRTEASAILRIEISTIKETAIGKGVLSDRGYSLIGHIPDFYEPGDDYFMYAKHIHRAAAGEEKEGP
ncbi:MAG: GNAT family N-acetyltransferase [Rectinemataceae bacterium]|jgi:GNAT superfamily N-acetyltransferase